MVLESLMLAENTSSCCLLDADSTLWGQTIMDAVVLGGDELLEGLAGRGLKRFAVGLGAVGNNRLRKALFERAVSSGLEPVSAVHPASVQSLHASIGSGAQLFPCSVVNVGARVGVNVIVNTHAVVEHDCEIGDHVHVAPSACLCASVRVCEGAHIGAGAVVKQGVTVGAYAVVGAGSVVLRDVEARDVVFGSPAHDGRETGSDTGA